jgi:signal transduction histidine kinase
MRNLARSLRWRLVAVMVIPVILLALPAYFAFNHLQLAHQRATAITDDQAEVSTIAASAAGSGPSVFAGFQHLLGDDQLIVYRSSKAVFRGPPNRDARHFVVSAPFPGGRVEIVGDVESTSRLSFELTMIAAGALILVAVAALLGSRVALRSIRGPVARAADVVDRVSTGDLSAKVGDVGSQEFTRLAGALDTMTARLEEADQAQRRFLADLAHEIATPVSSIASLAAAVLDGTISDEESRAEAGRLLSGETIRLRELLDDLAHLRRLDLAESVAYQRVGLQSLLEDVAARFGGDARAAGVDLQVVSEQEHVEVDTDRRLVETALGNLVSNAIRYTPRGGRVRLWWDRCGGELVLFVRDSGIGIPKDEQSRVFDRFYRVEKSRGRGAGGSGLGLSIALRAAGAMGGRIEFDSEPGRGSEFRLVVPPEPPPGGDHVAAAAPARAADVTPS